LSVCSCGGFGRGLIGVIAFAGVDLVASFGGGNFDFAELAVPISILGIVAEAVLVMEFVGDFVERGFEFIDAADFEHAAASGLGKLLEQGLAVAILFVDVEDIAVVVFRAIVNLQDISDDIVLEKSFEGFCHGGFTVAITGKCDDDDGFASHFALKIAMRGNAESVVEVGLAVLTQGTFAVGADGASAGKRDAGFRAFLGRCVGRLGAADGGGCLAQEADVLGGQLHDIYARAVADNKAEVGVADDVFKEEF
jgi:hypothetical protein